MDVNTGLGSAFDFAKGMMDRFWPKQASEQEKMAAIAGLIPLLEEREDTIIDAQKSIIVAEMSQGDSYTKRARPTVVYAGLAFMFLVHVLLPFILKIIVVFTIGKLTADQITQLKGLMDITLPGEFWMAWGSVVSIWSLGRSAERRGMSNKLITMITGGK
jgi:hypothetical protein